MNGTGRIAGVGTALPEVKLAAPDMERSAGLGTGTLQALGIEGAVAPERDISPFHLTTRAARAALVDAGLVPGDVDLIVAIGHVRYEYLCWALSMAIMKELEVPKAIGYDLADYTGSALLMGLRCVAARFRADPRPRTCLLAAYQRSSDLVDREQAGDRWLFHLGDGGAALVVTRDGAEGDGIVPLGHAFASDGPGSGLLGIRFEVVDEGPSSGDFFHHEWAMARTIMVRDGPKWYADYCERSARSLAKCVEKAVRRSGLAMRDVERVQAGFLYPEVAGALKERLGLDGKLRWHNAHGHLGGNELAFALSEMRGETRLQGKHVVLAAAGLPATYGAMVVRL